MEDPISDKGKVIKETAEAVTGLLKAVPVYEDVVQPAAKQVGQSIETVAKVINVALAPISALVWGYEKIQEFINSKVAEKLKNVPAENIVTPPIEVAGPALEALRFAGNDPNLSELFANLLATSMDKNTTVQAHPCFTEIIRNLSSDEALLLTVFVNNYINPLIDIKAEHKEYSGSSLVYQNFSNLRKKVSLRNDNLVPSYINNLCRLGLLTIMEDTSIRSKPHLYEELQNDPEIDKFKSFIKEKDRTIVFTHKSLVVTQLGKQFIENVVSRKE